MRRLHEIQWEDKVERDAFDVFGHNLLGFSKLSIGKWRYVFHCYGNVRNLLFSKAKKGHLKLFRWIQTRIKCLQIHNPSYITVYQHAKVFDSSVWHVPSLLSPNHSFSLKCLRFFFFFLVSTLFARIQIYD